jgi:hypothetical protein
VTPRVVEARKSPTGTNRRLNVQEDTAMLSNKTKARIVKAGGTALFALAAAVVIWPVLEELTGRKWG